MEFVRGDASVTTLREVANMVDQASEIVPLVREIRSPVPWIRTLSLWDDLFIPLSFVVHESPGFSSEHVDLLSRFNEHRE